MADEPIRWNAKELEVFAKSLRADKSGRALKQDMEARFDAITEPLRDRLEHGVSTIAGAGSYPEELAESLTFKTKIIGGKNARVQIVGEGKTRKGKWREVATFLDKGFLYHPAWGHWRGQPAYLRQRVGDATQVEPESLERSEPQIRDDIRDVLNDYLDRLVDIRKGF